MHFLSQNALLEFLGAAESNNKRKENREVCRDVGAEPYRAPTEL